MQDEILKKYFLGFLDPKEIEELEIQFFEDDSLEARFLQAENELIGNYLNSNLTNEETKAFISNYLNTDERIKRVEFIELLRNYPIENNFSAEKVDFFTFLKNLFIFPKIAVSFSILLIICLITFSYFIFTDKTQNTEFIALNKQDLSDLTKFKDLKVLTLTVENLRSVDNQNLIILNDLNSEVLIRLSIPNKAAGERNFTALIENEQNVSETLTNLKTTDQEIRILVPPSLLRKGEYRLSLSNEFEKYSYYFAVK